MSVTSDERTAICDTLAEVGPDEPTLCGDWTTRDLLAHLLVRERRPDAAAGIILSPLAGYTKNVMASVAEQSYDAMIATFRGGPPWWTVFAIPGLGDRLNLFEFYVHHEDIRRAQPDWESRPSDQKREDALWGALTSAGGGRILFRRCRVGVILRAAGRDDAVVHKGDRSVHLVGEPSELTLIAFGRQTELSRVVVQGDPDDVDAFEASPRGF
jgi:uncharacterized protein (TIGR03085 family)